jgi:protein arginine N-methyltransferase 1
MPKVSLGYENPAYHKLLLDDSIRNTKFRQAICNTVKKGDIVIDIGTGTGILAFYALEAGAQTVYAVEQNENILNIARQEAVKRGVTDQIQFLHANLLDLPEGAIPQKADVVISETIGNIGIDEPIIPLMLSVKRFMKPEGKFIPRSLSVFVAPFQAQERLRRKLIPPCNPPITQVQINDLTPAERAEITYLDESPKLVRVDFDACDSGDIKSQLKFTSLAETNLCGLCGWFEVRLDEQTRLSNSPHCPALHWAQLVFKLPAQFLLQAGETLTVSFKASSTNKYTLCIFDLSSNRNKGVRLTGLFQH